VFAFEFLYVLLCDLSDSYVLPYLRKDVLIMPIRKVSKLSDLIDSETADIFFVVQRIQNAFEKCYSTSANTMFLKEESDVSMFNLHVE